jgi:hypothetical protein
MALAKSCGLADPLLCKQSLLQPENKRYRVLCLNLE